VQFIRDVNDDTQRVKQRQAQHGASPQHSATRRTTEQPSRTSSNLRKTTNDY